MPCNRRWRRQDRRVPLGGGTTGGHSHRGRGPGAGPRHDACPPGPRHHQQGILMAWFAKLRSLIGQGPIHEAAGRGRRALAWLPSNPGAVAALLATHTDLRTKSRDLVRRNAWDQAGIEAFVANAVCTGIKPQSLSPDERFKTQVQALWWDWCGRRPMPRAHRFLRPAGSGLPGHARRWGVSHPAASSPASRTGSRCPCSCNCWSPSTCRSR